MISSPANLEHVLKTNFDNYPKGRPFSDRLVDLLGRGIFNVDGDEWRAQRKSASHIFTMKALRESMAPVFIKHASILLSHLQRNHASSPQHATSRPVDIQDCFFRFTLDSIAIIAFGLDLHCLDFADTVQNSEGGGRTRRGTMEATKLQKMNFAAAFDQAQRIADKRFFTPSWQLYKMLGIGDEGRMSRALLTINSFASHVILERRSCDRSHLSQQTDLLSTFLLRDGGVDEQTGQPFTEKFLRDIILNFIIAGRDTTAQLLTWCVYEMCKKLDVQRKVMEEIDRVLGSNPPTYDSMSQLVYMHAVLHETLRLHPSVPVELKTATKDDILPDGNVFVPAGTVIVPLIQAMMRRKEVYGDDVAEFKPERWIIEDNEEERDEEIGLPHNKNTDATHPSSSSPSSSSSSSSCSQPRVRFHQRFSEFEFPAFQAGPRTCLGKQMALLEAKLALSSLMSQLQFELMPGLKVEEEVALTLPSRYPMMVYVRSRHSL